MSDVPMTFAYRGKLASEMSKEELCCIILEQIEVARHLQAENQHYRKQAIWVSPEHYRPFKQSPASSEPAQPSE